MRSGLFTLAATAVVGLVGFCVSGASAQQASPQPVFIRGGQSNMVYFVDVTPPATSYALTGEANANQQSAKDSARAIGPVFQFGNGRVYLRDAR